MVPFSQTDLEKENLIPGCHKRNRSCLSGEHNSLDHNYPKNVRQCLLSGSDDQPQRNWDLDHGVLLNIMSRVPDEDLFVNVSWVCQSWQRACFGALFWSRSLLDLTSLDAALKSSAWCTGSMQANFFTRAGNFNLIKFLQYLMEGNATDIVLNSLYNLPAWKNSIEAVDLPHHFPISDDHLMYIVKRTPCVKNFALFNRGISPIEGFGKALTCWIYLTELQLGNRLHERYIMDLSLFCMRLEILDVHEPKGFFKVRVLNWLKILPRLRKLSFHGGRFCATAILALFRLGSSQLEEVCFNGCDMIKTSIPPIDQPFEFHIWTFTLKWTKDDRQRPVWHVASDMEYDDFESEFNTWMTAYTPVHYWAVPDIWP